MRIPDEILKCVVFLGREKRERGHTVFKCGGTAFIIGMPMTRVKNCVFHYLVTAQHVAEQLTGKTWGTRVNTRDGGFKVATAPTDATWWLHRTESEVVDAAVIPWTIEEDEDSLYIPTEMFLTDEKITENHIGPGDEVFMVGLFTRLEGRSRNIPIVRTGNVAMMPGNELLPGATVGGKAAEIEAYLIEARSIGGVSGSPVFVRETVGNEVRVRSRSGRMKPTQVQHPGDHHLLGLMHGHWEILPEDRNEVEFEPVKRADKPESVNLGIAIVVPAKKILEVLNQPALAALRERMEDEILKQQPTTEPDHAFGDRKKRWRKK
jgi:hypothetical protein